MVDMSVKRQDLARGFTLIELVIVILLLGFLAVQAIPRFLDAKDNAEAASLEGVAGGFATAVAMVKAQWVADGASDVRESTISTPVVSGSRVLVDGIAFNVNEFGWVDNVTGGSVGFTDQTVSECEEVFNFILQSPPRTTVKTDVASRKRAKYAVSVIDNSDSDRCRYELIVDDEAEPEDAEFYFEYELATGRVITVIPENI